MRESGPRPPARQAVISCAAIEASSAARRHGQFLGALTVLSAGVTVSPVRRLPAFT